MIARVQQLPEPLAIDRAVGQGPQGVVSGSGAAVGEAAAEDKHGVVVDSRGGGSATAGAADGNGAVPRAGAGCGINTQLPKVVKPLERGGRSVFAVASIAAAVAIAAAAAVIFAAARRITAVLLLLINQAESSEQDHPTRHACQRVLVACNGSITASHRELLPRSAAAAADREAPHIREVANVRVHTAVPEKCEERVAGCGGLKRT